MKKLLIILCILTLCSSSFAGGITEKLKAVVGRQSVAADGGFSTGDIVSEWFDGAGYQRGTCGSTPCWTESLNSIAIDEDNTDLSTTGFSSDALEIDGSAEGDARTVMNLSSSVSEGYVRFYLYISAYNEENRVIFNMMPDGGNFGWDSNALLLVLDGTESPYTLKLFSNSGQRDSVSVASGASHKIEVYMCNNGDASCIENSGSDGWAWWVNDSAEGNAADDPSGDFQDVGFGISYAANNITLYFDHFDIDSSARID